MRRASSLRVLAAGLMFAAVMLPATASAQTLPSDPASLLALMPNTTAMQLQTATLQMMNLSASGNARDAANGRQIYANTMSKALSNAQTNAANDAAMLANLPSGSPNLSPDMTATVSADQQLIQVLLAYNNAVLGSPSTS